MSENFEESPLSDGRMDTSETTSSGTEISPAIEDKFNTAPTSTASSINSSQSKYDVVDGSLANGFESCVQNGGGTLKVASDNANDQPLEKYYEVKEDNDLNNVFLDNGHKLSRNDRPKVLRLGYQPEDESKNQEKILRDQTKYYNSSTTHRSELTVANSHPLMSPPGTDSDSESCHVRVHIFPDVIPDSEPIRLVSNAGNIRNNTVINSNKMNSTGIKMTTILGVGKAVELVTQDNLDVTADCYVESIDSVQQRQKQPQRHQDQQRRKISVMTPPSPDILSSESDQDISQYQATVEPNYQSVALISNNPSYKMKMPSPKPLSRRKIPVSADLLADDMSSLDSISNHSFDGDMEHNLASLSPSSSVLDGFNDRDDDFIGICGGNVGDYLETPTNLVSEPIPTYTAEDEKRNSRNWQKITLPDGRTREIDMKVIEPYKRILSHGGYLKAGGHNAIVVFCACHLPDRSRTDYHYVMDNLFLYVVKTLEQLVTDDYVLVYLHGGSSRRNVPPFPWLKKCYQLLDRRLRKSLKTLYLVHPTFWLKSVVWMSRPFVSSKFWRKLIYVRSLDELYNLVSLEKASIPDKVKNYDAKYT